MGSREWTYWLAYFELYPSGDDWEQTALLAWASIAPHSKHPPRISDFLPASMRAEQSISGRMSPEQIRAVLKGKR